MSEYINPFAEKEHYHEHAEWVDEHLSNYFDGCEISVFYEIPTLDLHCYLCSFTFVQYNLFFSHTVLMNYEL